MARRFARACVRSYLTSWQMDDYTNRDVASAIIRSDDGDFCVSSLYLNVEFKPENTTFMDSQTETTTLLFKSISCPNGRPTTCERGLGLKLCAIG